MTGEEFARKYDENQLKEIARDIAGSIMIREYINGNSYDTRRQTTKKEQEIIRNIAYGAMLAYRFRKSDIDGILDEAEFTLMQFLPEANTYDTIYIPIRKVTKTGCWE